MSKIGQLLKRYKPSLTNKNQLMKITKCLYTVKREVTHKVIHPESIFKMHHIIGILKDHIATSQLATTNSQVTSV